MTREERKAERLAREATLPGFGASDGSVTITARVGELRLDIDSDFDAGGLIFNTGAVPLEELRQFIRGLVAIYNWKVREANKGAAEGLPALEQLAELKLPPGGST